ncbi:pseudaminic acid synthase [Candidatus Peregrinibacteria bacterium]|nr:pseudaminic acid synthase [Candidatus Peregrinibacteria bacterium]
MKTPKGERKIGPGHPCFIIAEMSGNHNQSFEMAVEIIKAAAESGADAIKLQTYTPDSMTIDCKKDWFLVAGNDNPDVWKGKYLYNLYETAYTPRVWHSKLKKIAEDLGLVFFSTPFDPDAVDYLETLGVPCYKVASYEATDTPLLRRIAKTKKPVIISMGFASKKEVKEAIGTLRSNGSGCVAVLYCVTAYTSKPVLEHSNLRTMLDIKDEFNVVTGFSDNNGGIEIPLQAVLMGASIVEKHFSVSRGNGGVDEDFSVDPKEFKEFVDSIRRAEKIMGQVHYGTQSTAEEYNKRFRRSIFVITEIKKGDKFDSKNIRVIRPNFGLAPKYFDEVIDKTATQDIERGTPLDWSMVKK